MSQQGQLAAELGMASFDHRLPESTTEAELLALIARLNTDKAVHGILGAAAAAQAHLTERRVLMAVDLDGDRRRLPSAECRTPGHDRFGRAARLSGASPPPGVLDAAAGTLLRLSPASTPWSIGRSRPESGWPLTRAAAAHPIAR